MFINIHHNLLDLWYELTYKEMEILSIFIVG